MDIYFNTHYEFEGWTIVDKDIGKWIIIKSHIGTFVPII
jgi:hypothetical protein